MRFSALLLVCVTAVSAAFPLVSRAEELFIPDCADVSLDGIPREWTEVTDETRRLEILHQPVEALKSAPKAVSTFSAKITMEMKMVPNAEWMKEIAANYGDGLYHNDAVIEFAADYGQNKTYRKVKRLSLSRTVTGDSADTLTTVSTAYAEETHLSVETPREFSCRNYTEGLRVVGGPGVSDKIPGFPSVPLENLVTVDPPREAKRWGDSQKDFDLNQFYGSAKQRPVEWEDLVLHVGILDGSVKVQDEKIVRGLKEGLHVLETTDEKGDRWFCWHHAFKGGAAIDYIWRESSGFLPVCHLNISKNKKRYIVKKAQWNHAGGAYVPAEIVECNYGETGEQTVNRRIRFTDTAVNQPIDPDRFSLKALELPEGGIIDDRVQEKVFEYKNGEPVFLAEYHSTKYMKKEDLETPGACRSRPAEDGVSEQPAETSSQPAESDARDQIGGGILASIANADDLLKLADEGDEAAQLFLGEAFVNAGKTEAEKAKGVEWIRKAAEHEDYTPAHYKLGMCYAEGNGIERDDAEAFKWFEKGAAEGQFVSQYQLALCYIDGRGTEQNKEAGIEILRKLAEDGFEDAKAKLAELGAE